MVDWRISGATQNDNETVKTRKYEKLQKKSVFPKIEGVLLLVRRSHQLFWNRLARAHLSFIHSKVVHLSGGWSNAKTGILVTFGRFRAFPDLWRHTYREFLSVIIDLAYRSNETFCSRTHSFGWERLHRVSWRGRKVHRNGDYNAAHFEFCRIAWRPPGHPRRLSLGDGAGLWPSRPLLFFLSPSRCTRSGFCLVIFR